MRMENVSIVLAEGCYTDIGPNSPFYLVMYINVWCLEEIQKESLGS